MEAIKENINWSYIEHQLNKLNNVVCDENSKYDDLEIVIDAINKEFKEKKYEKWQADKAMSFMNECLQNLKTKIGQIKDTKIQKDTELSAAVAYVKASDIE